MPRAAVTVTVTSVLLGELDNAFDRRSWHGPNLMASIRGLSAADAAARVHGRKTIWEQMLHAAYWKQRVASKLGAAAPLGRKGSDWPAAPADASESAWRGDVELLREIHRRLRAAVEALPPERLDGEILWLIHGAAAHDLYHAGQIRLLRRMQGLTRRPARRL